MRTLTVAAQVFDGIRATMKSALGRWIARWGLNVPFSRLTIGARIVVITIALALPLNLVNAIIIWHLSEAASEVQRTSLMYTARSVAAAANAKLSEYMALGQALARSPTLLEDNLDAFEAEARRAFAASQDAFVVVANYGGRQFLNTSRKLGQALPLGDPIALETQERAFETHTTVISDVHFSPVSQEWVIHIEVPIFKDGEPFRTLAIAVKAQSFVRLLNDQHIPSGWIAAILDSQGRFISRASGSADDERYIGQLSSESWRNLKDQQGIYEALSLEGQPVIAAKIQSALGGWQIGVGVEKVGMQAATWRAIRWALLLGGGFSIISLLLAAAVARSITGPIDHLRNKAATLMVGPLRGPQASGPPEVKELWRALRDSAVERHRKDEVLRESEQLFRGIYQNAATGITIADLSGRFQACNPAYAAMHGYSEEQLYALSYSDIIHPEDRDRHASEIKKLIAGEIPSLEIANRCMGKDGRVLWVVKRVSLLKDTRGIPTNIIALVTDVTERKQAELALQHSKERLRAIVATAVDAIIVIDEKGQIQSINPAGERIFGYLCDELVGRNVSVLMPDPYRSNHDRYLSDYQETAKAKIIGIGREVKGRRKDGAIFAADLSVAEWHAGGKRYFAGTIRDITQRKQAAERLEAMSKELTQTLEIMPTGLTRCGRDLRYLSANRAYAQLYRRPPEEIVGRSLVDVMGAEAFRIIHPYIERVLAGETLEFEKEIRYDGHLTVIEAVYVPDRDSDGIVQGWVASVHDITARKRAEELLRLAMREVNHRSKNLLSLVQAIARQTASTSTEDFLSRFGDRIGALAAGQDLLVKNEWNGVELGELVRSQLAYFADAIGTRIMVAGPPITITSAAAQTLGMALHELATNAGKYGALSNTTGTITIAWDLRQERDDPQKFSLSWHEFGGPAVAQPSVKGFGSTVIDGMINMMLNCDPIISFEPTGFSWRIECEAVNVMGQSVPRSISIPEHEKKTLPGQKRVLVVEDEALLAMDVASALSRAGLKIIGPAASVAAAFALMDRQGCDIAVLDINLGAQTAEPIACKLKEAGIPFVTMSGYTRQQQPPVFDGAPFVPKPLQLKRLVSEVERCLTEVKA